MSSRLVSSRLALPCQVGGTHYRAAAAVVSLSLLMLLLLVIPCLMSDLGKSMLMKSLTYYTVNGKVHPCWITDGLGLEGQASVLVPLPTSSIITICGCCWKGQYTLAVSTFIL